MASGFLLELLEYLTMGWGNARVIFLAYRELHGAQIVENDFGMHGMRGTLRVQFLPASETRRNFQRTPTWI